MEKSCKLFSEASIIKKNITKRKEATNPVVTSELIQINK